MPPSCKKNIFKEAKAWGTSVIVISLLYVEKVIFYSVKRS